MSTPSDKENEGKDLFGVREDELDLILAKRKTLAPSGDSNEVAESTYISEKPNTPAPSTDPNVAAESKDAGEKRRKIDEKAWSSRLLGLAFSGGGIRSATFNLGILQSLARHRLLRRVDYLSTVSGGGYIGSWLTSLLHREHYRLGMEAQRSSTRKSDKKHAIYIVEERLDPSQPDRNRANIPEDPAIGHLRSYSNYLSPKLGILSADTWALITTYLRNVLLNQTILILAIGILMLLPLLAATLLQLYWDGPGFSWALILLILGLGTVAVWQIGRNVAAVADTDPAKPNPIGTGPLLIGALAPLAIIAFLASPLLAEVDLSFLRLTGMTMLLYAGTWGIAMISAGRAFASGWLPMDDWNQWLKRWFAIVFWGFFAAVILGASLYGIRHLTVARDSSAAVWLVPPLILLAIVLTEMIHIGLASKALRSQQREWLSRFAAWMMILAIGWLGFAGIVFVGPFLVQTAFSYDFLGEAVMTGWVGTTITGLVAGRGTREGESAGWIRNALIAVTPYLFIVGLLLILAHGVHLGLCFESSSTTCTMSWKEVVQGSHPLWRLVLGLAIAFALLWLFARRFDINEFSLHHMYENRLTRCYLGATTACRFPNPFTGFSLQDDMPLWTSKVGDSGGYRLGSTEQDLSELPYTFKVPQDEAAAGDEASIMKKSVSAMRSTVSAILSKEESAKARSRENFALKLVSPYPGPYHLINTAINLVGGERLAWQERKAASFTLAPLYCGFRLPRHASEDERCRDPNVVEDNECNFCIKRFLDEMATVGESVEELQCPFYDRSVKECLEEMHGPSDEEETRDYFDFRPTREFSSEPNALTIGDAMATSGAAASPNMGYHTTPAFAFLLALFNIRLGRWVGNPLEHEWKKSGPGFALRYFFSEALGLTNKSSKFVYLSDGGHFENLGIYELVRRHCRYIIACDAGADPDYTFEDLANAIRKCRIDFGVDIEIDVSEMQHQDEHRNNATQCALGYIRYPDDKIGTLLYIKAARPSDMPTDILQYAIEHASFPHETTVDQFFSESQFESYRRLGLHIGDSCLADSVERARVGRSREVSIAALFRDLRQRWYKRSSSISANFTRLSATLDSIFKRLGETEELAFLDKQFYPEWRVLPSAPVSASAAKPDSTPDLMVIPDDPGEFRAGFFFCNSLIQLAENVYLDLNFELEHDHPDNAGWMNLFRHWSWSGMFRVTWAVSAATYGRRFRVFCERYLELKIGEVELCKIDENACDAIRDNPAERPKTNMLNILERRQLAYIFEQCEGTCVYQLDLAVRMPAVIEDENAEKPDALRTFSFGYAVIVGETLVMLRIQDHLRRMELGRRALRNLFAEVPDLKMSDPEEQGKIARHLLRREMLGALGESGIERHMEGFEAMFEEVRAEAALDRR